MFTIALLQNLIHAAITAIVGLLIRNHFETVVTMIIRRPLPESLLNNDNYTKAMKLVELIGLLIIITSVIMAFISIGTWSIAL